MANTLQTMLKAEISRLSKKEIKTAVAPLMKTTAELRKQVRDLKKQLAGYVKAAGISVPVVEEKPAPSVDKMRFSAKNIKALRMRHNMTQAEMAKALGVSKMAVSGWEQGRSKPRGETVRLAMAKFQQGCSGAHLDIRVRGPLWARGLDFNHGTGHGVGYLLNVHEGPQNINWKIRVNGGRRGNATPLEEGMLTSDEPGLYLEGKYGIRTENLLLCKKAERNEYGQFMEFETVTLVPYEREAVLPEMLTREELEWLNRYHKKVYETIGPMLTEEERRWLKEATAEIG